FYLEHAKRIRAAEHAVNSGIFGGDGGKRPSLAVMLVNQIKRLTQTRQHAEPEHIDLENAERVEIVLVPLDESAIVHCRIADRHHLIEPPAPNDETPNTLREMAWTAVNLARQCQELAHAAAVRIEAGAGDGIFRHRAAAAPPDRR